MSSLEKTANRENSKDTNLGLHAMRNTFTVFVLLVFIGFPGELRRVIGSGIGKILEYVAFAIEFVLVMFSSGNNVMEIKLINLRAAFVMPYLYAAYVTVDSLIVTVSTKTVIMTIIHMVLTMMFAFWLIEQFELEEMMTVFYYAQFLYIMVCLACVVVFPHIAFYNYHGSRTFRGLFLTKNECGTELSFGILTQCILLRKYKAQEKPISLVFLLVFVIQFGLMLMTKNMGALIITMGYIAYMFYYSMQQNRKKKKRLPLGLLFVIVTIGFLFIALTVLQALGPFLESLGKDASLTGRVPLWERVIAVMQESHTMTGYGLEMFWKTPKAVEHFHAGFAENTWAATSSASTHNMIMELWCNIGLIGVSLYFLIFLAADRGIKYLDDDSYLFCSSYIVLFTIRSLTERQSDPSSVYWLLSMVSLGKEYYARWKYKQDSMKKARIYVPEGGGVKVETSAAIPDWGAFQKNYSIAADVRRPVRSETVQKRVTQEMHSEEDKKLERLLEDFYVD